MSQTIPVENSCEARAIIEQPVLLFSGQGSQEAGMGRALAEQDPEAMALWKRAEAASGLPLREIYWEGDETAMNDTRAVQPALTVANYNTWRSFAREQNIKPVACAGHSLGEFGALAAAGVISPEDAVEITALRGRLMAEADPQGLGAMAAIVRLEQPEVLEIVKQTGEETGELLLAANFNTPGQTVISGMKTAVEAALKKAKERKGRGIFLKVSGAFHTPLMKEANDALAPVLEKTLWKEPAFPVYCNVDGKPARTGEAARRNLLRQMVSPVQWVNLVRNLYLSGVRWWMEISPRAVLGKMIGPSLAGIASECDSMRVEVLNSLTNIINTTL